MRRGSLMRVSRKQGPDVWQFRWSERDLNRRNRRRVYRKKVLGSAGRYADEAATRCALTVFLAEINSEKVRLSSCLCPSLRRDNSQSVDKGFSRHGGHAATGRPERVRYNRTSAN